MKRQLMIGIALLLPVSAAASSEVRTRAWCASESHGRAPDGGYAWISPVIIASTSDECWRFANGHAQSGHKTGCSYVDANGNR